MNVVEDRQLRVLALLCLTIGRVYPRTADGLRLWAELSVVRNVILWAATAYAQLPVGGFLSWTSHVNTLALLVLVQSQHQTLTVKELVQLDYTISLMAQRTGDIALTPVDDLSRNYDIFQENAS